MRRKRAPPSPASPPRVRAPRCRVAGRARPVADDIASLPRASLLFSRSRGSAKFPLGFKPKLSPIARRIARRLPLQVSAEADLVFGREPLYMVALVRVCQLA